MQVGFVLQKALGELFILKSTKPLPIIFNGEGSYSTISYVTCRGLSWSLSSSADILCCEFSKDVDISAILTELSALSREIRAVTQPRSELEQPRRSLDHPREQSNSFDKCSWTTIRNKVINEKTAYQKR